jgi:hypothetical protein
MNYIYQKINNGHCAQKQPENTVDEHYKNTFLCQSEKIRLFRKKNNFYIPRHSTLYVVKNFIKNILFIRLSSL